MAKFSLRRFDSQAQASVLLAVAAVVTLAGQAFIVLQNLDTSELIIPYGSNRKMAVFAATGITILLSLFALGFGYNSVGQRRNDKQAWSWLGFFGGAAILSLAIIVFVLFYLRGEPAVTA